MRTPAVLMTSLTSTDGSTESRSEATARWITTHDYAVNSADDKVATASAFTGTTHSRLHRHTRRGGYYQSFERYRTACHRNSLVLRYLRDE